MVLCLNHAICQREYLGFRALIFCKENAGSASKNLITNSAGSDAMVLVALSVLIVSAM